MVDILVPAGIGDIYWVMIKMQSFIEKRLGGEIPTIYTCEVDPKKSNRSQEFMERIPFVKYGGGFFTKSAIGTNSWFGTDWLIPDYEHNGRKFDYLFCLNGVVRNGFDLERECGLDAFETNWYFPINPAPEEDVAALQYRSELGNYVVGFFSGDGMFSRWVAEMNHHAIYDHLTKIHERTGFKIVLTGKDWDWDTGVNQKILALDANKGILVNKLGQTTVNQLFALMKNSKGIFGWHGGNTMMGVVFKVPTFMIWSKYFKNSKFYENCLPPDKNGWYDFDVASNWVSGNYVDRFLKLGTHD
jgi:hypothetical protein